MIHAFLFRNTNLYNAVQFPLNCNAWIATTRFIIENENAHY